jgi:hypothetical protein
VNLIYERLQEADDGKRLAARRETSRREVRVNDRNGHDGVAGGDHIPDRLDRPRPSDRRATEPGHE